MFCKPRTTHLHPRALLYKRFTNIERSTSISTVYRTSVTINGATQTRYWVFNIDTLEFEEIPTEIALRSPQIVHIANLTTVLTYLADYYWFADTEWRKSQTPPDGASLLSVNFGNIAKYQTNKYYFSGSFDYTIQGEIEGTTTQPIRGNIMSLTSFNIKHFNDSIQLNEGDLVVIDNHLYSVENPSQSKKHFPKDFNIYFATLNSII